MQVFTQQEDQQMLLEGAVRRRVPAKVKPEQATINVKPEDIGLADFGH